MKVINVMIAFLLVLAIQACKQDCKEASSAATVMTGVVVRELQCKNTAEVQKSMSKVMADVGLCQMKGKYQGPIADMVCPLAVNGVLALSQNKIPSEWQCDATQVTADLSSVLTKACKSIPF